MSKDQPPSVDSLARRLVGLGLPHGLSVRVAREAVAAVNAARASGVPTPNVDAVARNLALALVGAKSLRMVNATGVIVHTNLGRAPWSGAAVNAASAAAGFYTNLELDTATGDRGRRGRYVCELVCELIGGEDALVVNNNAAALLLVLSVLADGGSAIVSRGELIEIGGSYRLPELMAASGARMVEVGTTNRTRLRDYESAVDESTALLLKVHKSNYEITGFTEEVSIPDLKSLGERVGVPLVFDAGSGLLDATTPWLSEHPPPWLAGEPGIRQSLAAGADLVTFSGDKLLGGPQAGITVGNAGLVERLRASPIARALRVDGVTLAALGATLEAYADRRVLDLPLWRMVSTPHSDLEQRCHRILEASGHHGRVVGVLSQVGGGSVPGKGIPSPGIVLDGPADTLFQRLLSHAPPVLARRSAGQVVLDVRTVDPDEDPMVVEAIRAACQ